jgi:hypothetical protein
VVQEDDQVREYAQGRSSPPGVANLAGDRLGIAGVARGDEDDICRGGREPVRQRPVSQGGHHRLSLGRAGGDRGSLDAEPAALEVDVVQLVAVDEPAARDIADHRVVGPAVPEAANYLDRIGGLTKQPGDMLREDRISQASGLAVVPGGQFRELAAAEVRGLAGPAGHLRAPAGPPGADVVERGDGGGHVERLGVRGRSRGHQPDPRGRGRDLGGDQHRVEPSADLVGPAVRAAGARGGLQAERVLDGDEVQQPALGLRRQGRPVARGEQVPGRAPGSRHPTGCHPAPSSAAARWSPAASGMPGSFPALRRRMA